MMWEYILTCLQTLCAGGLHHAIFCFLLSLFFLLLLFSWLVCLFACFCLILLLPDSPIPCVENAPPDLTAVFKTNSPVPKFLRTFSVLSYVTRPGDRDSSYVRMSGFQIHYNWGALLPCLLSFLEGPFLITLWYALQNYSTELNF